MNSNPLKKVRIGIMLAASLCAAQAFGYNVVVTQDDRLGMVYDISITLNEKAQIETEELDLTLTRIDDSRCPLNAICVWQGNVAAQVTVDHHGLPAGRFDLTNTDGLPDEVASLSRDAYSVALQTVPAIRDGRSSSLVIRLIKRTKNCATILTSMCTMEFLPVTCQLGDLSVQGSNNCQGKLQLEYEACKRGQFFDEELTSCKPNDSGFALEGA